MGFFGFLKKQDAPMPPVQPPPKSSLPPFTGDIPPPPGRSQGAPSAPTASDDEFNIDLGPVEAPPDESFQTSFMNVTLPVEPTPTQASGVQSADNRAVAAPSAPNPVVAASRVQNPIVAAPTPRPEPGVQTPDDLPDFTAEQIAAAEKAATAAKPLPVFDDIAPLPSLEVSGEEYYVEALEYGLALKTIKALKGVVRQGDKSASSLGSLVSKHQDRYAKFADSLNGIQDRLMLMDDLLTQR